jgi:hypothetical protein
MLEAGAALPACSNRDRAIAGVVKEVDRPDGTSFRTEGDRGGGTVTLDDRILAAIC